VSHPEGSLPVYLGTWTDKAFTQCMYTISWIWAWSLLHFKGDGWYLDCGKGFYSAKEEAKKTAIDIVYATKATLASGPLDY
jgi:hypothetical protein